MTTETTNKKVVTSLIWKLLERFGTQGIVFIINIILARLLTPGDYGQIAVLAIFITVSQSLVASGMNTALVQKKEVEEKDFSSVFYTSLLISLFLYALLFFTAPLIAKFYNMPALKNILRVLALVLFPVAFNSIQVAKVQREMRFKSYFYSSLLSVILSAVVGISMAYCGFGAWALVGQQLTNQVSICIIMLALVKWRPRASFELKRLKPLYSFGWKLMLSSLLDTIYQNLSSMLIGNKYDAAKTGFFNRGKQFPQLIVGNVSGAMQAVLFPVFAQEQDNRERLKAIVRRSLKTYTFCIFPMLVGLAVVAEPMIKLILTDKWLPCVPFLQIQCITFAFYPMQIVNWQSISALGRSDIVLRLGIIKKAIGLPLLLISVYCFKNVLFVAVADAIVSILSALLDAYPNRRLLGYTYLEQLQDSLPAALLSFAMGALVYLITLTGLSNLILLLLLQVAAGGAFYLIAAKLLKLDSYAYIKNLLLGYLGARK